MFRTVPPNPTRLDTYLLISGFGKWYRIQFF